MIRSELCIFVYVENCLDSFHNCDFLRLSTIITKFCEIEAFYDDLDMFSQSVSFMLDNSSVQPR